MIANVLGIVVWLGLAFLAWIAKDMIIYYVAGLASIILGLALLKSIGGIALAVIFLGTYFIILGIISPFRDDKGAKGLTYFKNLWNRATKKG